jgi:hypothetical protein
MPWLFDQNSGRLYNPSGLHHATGYAGGNEGKNPEGVNNHAAEAMKSIGPLPCGLYVMQEPVPQSKLGPYAIPLLPATSNKMFGRGDFYCHGDTPAMNHSASEGCIIMPNAIRHEMWESGDHQVMVFNFDKGEM